jgi:hypothetical protein
MKNIIFVSLFLLLKFSLFGQICVGTPGRVQWEAWRGLFTDGFSELTALEYFPSKPDLTQTLYNLNAPINFDENFGAKISGFIKVPVSDSITFNITGNSKVEFYISPNQQASQMVLRAFTTGSTTEYEHNKFSTQTTQKLWLVQGQYYYFELRYVESTSTDHCKLFWKNSFVSPTTWNIITAAYINDIGCKATPCPPRNTPCNDGNANTIDDKADGHCNCVGKPTTTNTCIGQRSSIQRYRYDNRAGSTLNDLYTDPNFPAIPATSMQLPIIGVKSESQINNTGNLIQGYITVPVSGIYKFNVTGDDQTKFFLSSDASPANKNANTATVTGFTGTTEHSKYTTQSTNNVTLTAGQYYYIEVNHKEGTGSEHFGVFWQTPFTQSGTWKRVPSFYIYDYDCDLACVPQGVLCDDGNIFTNDDAYNSTCDCVGTPCSGADCDSPLASYVPYEKCGLTDQIDNQPFNNWLSCQTTINPNPTLPPSHWIMYDLGERHRLISSHIWNYNVANEAAYGFQNVRVDYSEDNVNWNLFGEFTWELATGDSGYGGFNGPNFDGIHARYILITSVDNFSTCRGLGKVAFKAIFCPVFGSVCDDNNPLTVNDVYDGECNCAGQNILENECDTENLTLGNLMLNTDVYSAINQVTSISQVSTQDTVGMIGGKSVVLNPGFQTIGDVVFIASIDTCATVTNLTMARANTEKIVLNKETESIKIVPIKDTDLVDIHYNIVEPGHIVLSITDEGKIYTIVDHEHLNKGHYVKRIRTKKLVNLSSKVNLQTRVNSLVDELKKEE